MLKQKAHMAVRKAIALGQLVRPMNCEHCGLAPKATSDGRSPIQAHHRDYSKPLEVEWICAKCHRQETPLPLVMGGRCVGEANGQSKFTTQDVIAARRLRQKGLPYSEIASRFGVDKKTAMRAIKGEQWAHVTAAPQPLPPAPKD